MNLLLDTHEFVWAVGEPSRLDRLVRTALVSPENQVMVSAVTPWEIAIKRAAGRLKFPLDLFDDTIERMGCGILPIPPGTWDRGRRIGAPPQQSFRPDADRSGADRGTHAGNQRPGDSALRCAGSWQGSLLITFRDVLGVAKPAASHA